MSNSGPAIAHLLSAEADAARASELVASELDGVRTLLHGAIVRRWGKVWQISTIRAAFGVVRVYGVRFYRGVPGRRQDQVGARAYDLGTLRECEIVHFAGQIPEPPQRPRRPAKPVNWHPNHPRGPS